MTKAEAVLVLALLFIVKSSIIQGEQKVSTDHETDDNEGNQRRNISTCASNGYCNTTLNTTAVFSNASTYKTLPSNSLSVDNENSVRSNNCRYIPSYIEKCPPGFYYISDTQTGVCATLKIAQTFPPSCPYPNHLPYYKMKKYLHFYNSSTMWLHAFRNISSGFANFEWLEDGLNYGTAVSESITNSYDAEETSCLILKNGLIFRVMCSEQHDTLCMYSPEQIQLSSVAQLCQQDDYDKCIIGDYDLAKGKCFCRIAAPSWPNKQRSCKKAAEPVFPYQTQLLIKYFGFEVNTCWFGLQKSDALVKVYKWETIKENTNSALQVQPKLCEYLGMGFTLNNLDNPLQCTLCEVNLHFNKGAMTLHHIFPENKIELMVQHPDTIRKFANFSIYCFSDSNNDDLKWNVPIKYDKIKFNTTLLIARLQVNVSYPSLYWCEAFEYKSANIIKSNTLLAYSKSKYDFDFAVFVNIIPPRGMDPFINKFYVAIGKYISQFVKAMYNKILSIRPVRGYLDGITKNMTMLMHLTVKNTHQTCEEVYAKLSKIVSTIHQQHSLISSVTLLSSEMCLAETTTTPNNDILMWPTTPIGSTVIPSNKLCLDQDNHMIPVIRKCEGDFLYGAKWAAPVGTCSKNTTHSESTKELFHLAMQDVPPRNATTELMRITKDSTRKQPIDVYFVSLILEKLSKLHDGEVDESNFTYIINNVMAFEKTTLKASQRILNSTDKILSSIDNFMNNQSPTLIVFPKLIVQISDLHSSDVLGLALYKKDKNNVNFTSYNVVSLVKNIEFDHLMTNLQLDTAVLLPTSEADKIKASIEGPAKLIIILFYSDVLFNEQETINKTATKIVSVTIPGYTKSLNNPIKVAYKVSKTNSKLKNCSHWYYGLNDLMISIYGRWKLDTSSANHGNLFEICTFFHMTHFGLLLQGISKDIRYDVTPLNVLTAIGSALSMIGIIPIFITALIFRTWRNRAGNIILINFCVAITLQIVAMFSLYVINEDGVICKAIGCGLHYAVLSEFCWMLVVALLQHRRFVMVFTKLQEGSIVKKCLLIGWGLPLVPIVVTLSISPNNYKFNVNRMCFTEGYYYLFGYFIPIALILCSNALIFIKIVYSVLRQTMESCVQRSSNYKLEILLATFLFFVLGMTWIFGIVGALVGEIWLTYVFCISATLRGLVLFLFFIVGNKETRQMWKKRSPNYAERKTRKSGNNSSVATTITNA